MTLGQNVPKLDALHLMDGIEGLRSLPKHSVDMLLTDPPYGTTRNFWDVPLPLPELWEAVRWAVKPNGAILFFAQCPFDKVLGASNLAMLRYYRKHKTLEGCPELTAEQVEKVKATMSQDWRKDPVPFPSYLLTNNNANIRRVRQRIEDLSHKAEFVGWTFPSGEAKVNEAENRLQLIFEDKPDADTRQALKSEGFKWAPSQGAWQRQLNQNAIRAAARLDFLRPEDGKSPYQLQPSAKRAEKDVSR